MDSRLLAAHYLATLPSFSVPPLGAHKNPTLARETSRFLQHGIAPQTQVELPRPSRTYSPGSRPTQVHPSLLPTQILPLLLRVPYPTRQPWITPSRTS